MEPIPSIVPPSCSTIFFNICLSSVRLFDQARSSETACTAWKIVIEPSCRFTLRNSELRIKSISQGVAEEVQGQHEKEHRDGSAGEFPPVAEPETLFGVVDDRAPARFVGDADTEVAEH